MLHRKTAQSRAQKVGTECPWSALAKIVAAARVPSMSATCLSSSANVLLKAATAQSCKRSAGDTSAKLDTRPQSIGERNGTVGHAPIKGGADRPRPARLFSQTQD